MLSCVQLFATLWTAAGKIPLSMGLSCQENWSGLPFPSPGDLPHSGIKPTSHPSAGGFFTTKPTRKSNPSTIYLLFPQSKGWLLFSRVNTIQEFTLMFPFCSFNCGYSILSVNSTVLCPQWLVSKYILTDP